jgi:hypothetical protein
MIGTMADSGEKTLSVLMRLLVSLVLPLWGLAMLVLGLKYGAGWWIGTGVVVGLIGAVMFVGSPVIDLVTGRR